MYSNLPKNNNFLDFSISALGNIHVLRKQNGGREGVSQMLTIAYVGGGGAKGSYEEANDPLALQVPPALSLQ